MTSGTTRSEVLSQVERINGSHLLRGSEALRALLSFLAEHALQNPDAPLKEQEIAEHVFEQPSGFDPRLDSRVRVQIKRLRERLSQYYEEVGPADRVFLQIPPGSYQLRFLYRDQAEARPEQAEDAVPTPPVPALRIPKWAWPAAAILLGIAIGWWVRGMAGTASPDPALRTLWRPFLSSDAPLLVIYGNPEFYDTGDLLRGIDGSMQGAPVNDSFTGVGEVMAAAELVKLFDGFGRQAAFRRSMNVSWEEAKNSNLVFLGAFSAAVKALPQPEKFAIRTLPEVPAGEVRTRILNLRPASGEPAYFAASPAPCCRATTEDHALVVFSQGLLPNRVTLMLAGITTLGTQAALEFMCRPSGIRTLLSRLPAGAKGQPSYFEAVIKVRISGGAPVHSEIVAVHLRRSES